MKIDKLPKQIAKAALFNRKGELLILTRSPVDQKRAGRFDFPGGGIDEGESPTEAVVRELQEEIGVSFQDSELQLMFTHTSYFEDLSSLRFLYVGVLDENTEIKLSHEHISFEWMTISDALQKYQHPVWIDGLKYLIENKQILQ